MKMIGLCYASWLILVIFTVADATTRQQCNRLRVHPREINLLENLIQETDYLNSMNFTFGPNEKSPAVLLDGSRGICVDNTNYTFQRHLHEYSCSRRKEFVIRACVKFDGAPDGPIFFLHSNNMTVLSLEVDATKGGSIKVSFVHEGGMRAISFPYTFTDLTSWHNISIIFNGRLVSLYVNCNKVADQIVMRPEYCLPEKLLLNIGDNPQHTETFQGCLQDLIISFKEKAIAKQCPKAHTDCRYSAVYQAVNNSISEMMDNYARLSEEVKVLRRNVTMYQNMAREYACYIDGNQYDYQTFFYSDRDTVCFCSEGGVARCNKLTDIPTPQTTPEPPPFREPCRANGKNVLVGDSHNEVDKDNICRSKLCEETPLGPGIFISAFGAVKTYHCNETLKDCTNAAKWTTLQRNTSQCCGFCTACEMQTDCGKNTNCVVKGVSYTCECKDGYLLEDGECVDINECNHGRHPEVGHYCPLDAECVNTDGGFNCSCPENHTFIDRRYTSECQDIDECMRDDACSAGFVCTNTVGSYTCTCSTGYIQDGDSCVPHCDPPCKPEGECVRPSSCKPGEECNNTCACPGGLNGKQCENDINECDRTDHGCNENATCINIHGSYFCRCNDGYRGNGRTCDDIDECAEQSANCPDNSTCVNTKGTYQCSCSGGDCKDGCYFQKKAYPINGTRYRGQKNCTVCRCNGHDKWTCSDVLCNCSQHPLGRCCSHCNKDTCTVEGEEYDHNEEFTHPSDPCRSCKCKKGNVSCTDMGSSFKCPPELAEITKNGCNKCKVNECKVENDGMEHEANNRCSVCTCKNKEWTCRAKVRRCPPVSCDGNTIMMGCCPVCEGSDNTRPPRLNLLLTSIVSALTEGEDSELC